MAPSKVRAAMKAHARSKREREIPVKVDFPAAEVNEEEDPPEKDETEERLEKLIFGDEAGFISGLNVPTNRKEIAIRPTFEDELSEQDHQAGDLDGVPDDELFFFDAGTGITPSAIITEKTEHEDTTKQPNWIDSDDDRLTISLASHTRLRKLRDTEVEDFISGREYIRRLRRQYERLHPTPAWAEYAHERKRKRTSINSDSDTSDSDVSMGDSTKTSLVQPLASLLRSGGELVRTTKSSSTKGRKLRSEVIDIQRLKDVAGHGASSVDTLQFHPYYPLILSAGPSSTAYLHHISPNPPNPNPLLTSLHMKGTPIRTAAFCCGQDGGLQSDSDSTQVFLSARRRYFHTWSLASGGISKVPRPMYGVGKAEQRTTENFKISPCGRYMGIVGASRKGGGTINVLSTETMQWMCSCRVDSTGGVADFAWWRDGEGFTVVGKNGEVSEYDVSKTSVVMRWFDEGAVGTTVIALGGEGSKLFGGDRWVAIGSSSGIVNIYDRKELDTTQNGSSRPKATKSFDQLTTPISHIIFSADGQMMVLASRWKRDALRIVHLPSCTVYRNWPTDKTPLGRVSSVAISPDGGYVAVGNEQGKIRLWEVRE